uniref:MSP domain-containing protein n=1 Tax=Mesocestoides corti TaxID=53468 RepID=A0A5K3EW75_MESCO
PSKEIAFGAVAVNTRTSGQVTIENGGAFDLRFAIFSAVRMQEMVSAKAARSSLRQRSSGPGPSDVTGASRVTLSPFTISPASGTIPVGGKQTISVECSVGAIAKVYEEELCIQISDRPKDSSGTTRLPFRLSVEACKPTLEVSDFESIFEEHRILQSRNEFLLLQNHDIVGGA